MRTITPDTLPPTALYRAGLRIRSLAAAGADIRPTAQQLVIFTLAVLASDEPVRFDPTGLAPTGKIPADQRFAGNANVAVGSWHTVLPSVWFSRNGDGTVTVQRSKYRPKGRSHQWCWHTDCPRCGD